MMSPADPRSHELAELRQCAYRLALAFGRDAEAAGEAPERLGFFELFERCFFAVRMATALELRLRRTPDQGLDRTRLAEAAFDRAEPADRERPERDRDDDGDALPRETDRERESEPASRTALLRTLGHVAADAARLPGPAPADLAGLQHLLGRAPALTASSGPQVPAKLPGPGLRARLQGSATVFAGPAASPVRPLAPARGATGPPR